MHVISGMAAFHYFAVVLLWIFTGVEGTTYGNPTENLRGSCSMASTKSGQISDLVERCQLVDNIKRYIEANLVSNFIGLKLKRDFAANLATLLSSNFYGSGSHVKYMAANNLPNYNTDLLIGLREALEAYQLAPEKDIEEEFKSDAHSFEHGFKKGRHEKDDLTKLMTITQIRSWLGRLRSARKHFSSNLDDFIKHWSTFLPIADDIMADKGDHYEPERLPLHASLVAMGLTDVFMRLFWPFRFDVSEMNQKLGIYGITNRIVAENIKSDFFKALEDIQAVKMPYAENEIILSFDHPELVDGMNRSKLVVFSKKFIRDEKHLFNEFEQMDITDKTLQAMALIEKTSPELYASLVQLVSCFAFYKTENPKYLGGSTSSALGVIWLDPSAGEEWTIPFYAEMIVHEFIHTHLFYAELVHGTYSNVTPLSEAKVVSAIRGQSRDYDKSLHAAYVAAGLATFHARAGYLERAAQLTKTLRSSVDELEAVNMETGVLDESGTAMLEFLVDYMALTKMGSNW